MGCSWLSSRPEYEYAVMGNGDLAKLRVVLKISGAAPGSTVVKALSASSWYLLVTPLKQMILFLMHRRLFHA